METLWRDFLGQTGADRQGGKAVEGEVNLRVKIDGTCHCGRIAYEAEVNPAHVGICHCTDCQTLSGSAFRVSVLTKREAFKLLKGQPKIYEKTTQKGEKRAQAFCPVCGTSIYSAGVGESSPFSIRVATSNQRKDLQPKIQIWCRSAQDWVESIGKMPKFQEQPALPE